MEPATKWMGAAVAGAVIIVGTSLFAGRAPDVFGAMNSWLASPEANATESASTSTSTSTGTGTGAALSAGEVSGQQSLSDQQSLSTASPTAENAAIPNANDPFVIKRVLPIDGPIKYGEWHWDDEGVPDGPLVMTVDIQARVISVFRNGYEIGAAAALLGTPEHPTPVGTFPILTKERHNVSEKYNNAPMPWTLRLTWDGVAVHGGSTVELGYASHGCIAVPDAFASKLYDIAKLGDVVIITDGQRAGIGSSIATGA